MPVRLDSGADDEGDEARIEIIPLIDIMFFLLASFMLVSLSMAHIRRIPVELPDAATGQPERRSPPVTVAIDVGGVAYVGTDPVGMAELAARVRERHSAESDAAIAEPVRVMVAADGRAAHADVLRVIDALRADGIVEIGFESRESNP